MTARSCKNIWPYPLWIAHRGAGELAPENTLAAFRLGACHGWRMFECDVRLSADEEVFLLHDNTLDRTTNGHGPACSFAWNALSRLDAGSWHSPQYAGEPLLHLERLAHFCQANHLLLNLEIKPSPGAELRTGEVIGRETARLWARQAVPPLLTSFSPKALEGSRNAAPQLPRGLLLDTLMPTWLEQAQALDCVAVVCHCALWDAPMVARVHAAGMRCLSYTVNEEDWAQHLLKLGTDGIISDRIDLFNPICVA